MINAGWLFAQNQKMLGLMFCGIVLAGIPEYARAGAQVPAKAAPKSVSPTAKAPAPAAARAPVTPPRTGAPASPAAPGAAAGRTTGVPSTRPGQVANRPATSGAPTAPAQPGRGVSPATAGQAGQFGGRGVQPGVTGQRPGGPMGAGQPASARGGFGAPGQPHGPVASSRVLPDKRVEQVHADGSRTTMGPNGHVHSFVSADGGTRVQYGRRGTPESVTRVKPGGIIETTHRMPGNPTMSRTIMPDRGGHGQMLIESRGRIGHVDRPIVGRPNFYRESRYEHGVAYARVYRGYRYHGYDYRRPVPVYIYSPGFYAWGARPWGAPVVYGWGWQAEPWYGVYGNAFTPYPVYSGLDQWMTDYLIATNMRLAYEAGQGAPQQAAFAGPGAGGSDGAYADAAPPPITPELKDEIAAQVKLEMAEQQQAAAQGAAGVAGPPPSVADGPPPEEVADALKPGHTLFRVVSPVTVQADGQPCSLTADDYISRTSDLKAPPGTVTVQVKASRSADCPKGSSVEVALNDLMVMEGDQDQRIMDGFKIAADNMGKNGLPTGPAAGETKVPLGQAIPDSGLADTLKQQQIEADADHMQALSLVGPAQ